MRLTVIGCSGSFPGPDSSASCYLLEAEDDGRVWRILLDLGNGSLGTLQRYVDPLSIDAVFLSHLHADHCIDLCGYYVMRRYHPDGAQERIPVWGPPGTAERMARAYDLPADPGMTEEFDFRTLEGRIRIGPFLVESTQVEHPVPAYAIKVTVGDRSLVYSGDTAVCPALTEIARGADLLLIEASFVEDDENPPGIHLTGRQAGRVAGEAAVGQVVLTHVPPWNDPERAVTEARAVYAGRLDRAETGTVFEI